MTTPTDDQIRIAWRPTARWYRAMLPLLRLKPGVTMESLEPELQALERLEAQERDLRLENPS